MLDAVEPAARRRWPSWSRATGLPRATAHRLAVALEAHGLVRRDADGRFALGLRLVALGRAAAEALPAGASAPRPALARAARRRPARACSSTCATATAGVCVAVARVAPRAAHDRGRRAPRLPLDRGSAGTVLRGRRRRPAGLGRERRGAGAGVASVARRCATPTAACVAAVSVSGPIERTTRTRAPLRPAGRPPPAACEGALSWGGPVARAAASGAGRPSGRPRAGPGRTCSASATHALWSACNGWGGGARDGRGQPDLAGGGHEAVAHGDHDGGGHVDRPDPGPGVEPAEGGAGLEHRGRVVAGDLVGDPGLGRGVVRAGCRITRPPGARRATPGVARGGRARRRQASPPPSRGRSWRTGAGVAQSTRPATARGGGARGAGPPGRPSSSRPG